jgi:hypothetical protein
MLQVFWDVIRGGFVNSFKVSHPFVLGTTQMNKCREHNYVVCVIC